MANETDEPMEVKELVERSSSWYRFGTRLIHSLSHALKATLISMDAN